MRVADEWLRNPRTSSSENENMKTSSLVAGGLGLAMVVLLAGCASDATGEGDTASSEDEISASDIMARANDYLTHDIVYCGGPRGGVDETGCGEGVCEQPIGPWDGYRSDCSGFVSYVWQIPSDPDTATYSYDQAGGQGWSTIPIDDLRAGDAVVAQGHIKLFSSFQGTNAALIYEEYDCNRIAHKKVQGFYRSGSEILFDGDSRPYHAIRRNALSASPKPPPPKKGPPTPKPAAPTACGEIAGGHGLAPGRAVRSCDNRFELVMQGDGNLVEYGPVGSMWSTQTSGSDGYAAVVQSDGNFVLYGKTSDALWNTETSGHGGAALELQNDGNLVVYQHGKALWNAGTVFTSAPPKATGCGEIQDGRGLVAGQSVKSCGGSYMLAMQTDGNLVMYRGSHAVWSSNTAGKKGYKAVMQSDGNFVVYDWRGAALWNSQTSGHPGSFLGVQDDGNVVVYAPGNKPVWASRT